MSAKIQTSLRLDADKLAEAKQILSQLGMNFSEAVNIFTNLIVAKQGLPFDVALPNEETKTSMLDVRARKNLETITLEQLRVKSVHNENHFAPQNVHQRYAQLPPEGRTGNKAFSVRCQIAK
jgi:DNA-damage-inducible protein J